MATGCFPIVTDLPANREWIKPGANGFLFPAGDPQALAQAVRKIAPNPSLRERARQENLGIIRTRALWPDNMMTAEQHLLHLIGRTP
jgi:glycosyltransferase involved in cell wall biosynthesis